MGSCVISNREVPPCGSNRRSVRVGYVFSYILFKKLRSSTQKNGMISMRRNCMMMANGTNKYDSQLQPESRRVMPRNQRLACNPFQHWNILSTDQRTTHDVSAQVLFSVYLAQGTPENLHWQYKMRIITQIGMISSIVASSTKIVIASMALTMQRVTSTI